MTKEESKLISGFLARAMGWIMISFTGDMKDGRRLVFVSSRDNNWLVISLNHELKGKEKSSQETRTIKSSA